MTSTVQNTTFVMMIAGTVLLTVVVVFAINGMIYTLSWIGLVIGLILVGQGLFLDVIIDTRKINGNDRDKP